MSAHQAVAVIVSELTQIRGSLAGSPLVVVGTFAAMGFFAVLTMGGSRLAAVVLLGLGLTWPVVDGQVEGPTLLALSWAHGVSAADLVGVAAVLLAAWRLVPRPDSAPGR